MLNRVKKERRGRDKSLIELLESRIEERRMQEGVRVMQLLGEEIGAPMSLSREHEK